MSVVTELGQKLKTGSFPNPYQVVLMPKLNKIMSTVLPHGK